MFLFERVFYRLVEVRSYVGDANLNAKLSNGQTVFQFYKEFTDERAELERKTAAYRYAVRLFADRNEGRAPVPVGGQDGADFFGGTDNYFD
jgi:hypothetical protein